MDIGGPEILIVIAVILLLFGGSKIPALARNLGEAVKELKAGIAGDPDPAAIAATHAPEPDAPEARAASPAGASADEPAHAKVPE